VWVVGHGSEGGKAVTYEAFNLRVVYKQGWTGFETSKEFAARPGDKIGGRYRVTDFLGSAAFSVAVACVDEESGDDVCLKVVKNNKEFVDQSLDEIKLLRYINAQGDVDEHHVIRMRDYFYHREHLFIVTELLKDNLYEFQRYLSEHGHAPYFTLPRIQRIARQVLTALAFIHAAGVLHCDLKPENILIQSYSQCDVKVIDFGSSCYTTDHMTSYIQSRSYRAPEVVLGCGYDAKIDVWSLGCILMELLTGDVLFQNDSVQCMLARVQGCLGDFPSWMLVEGKEVSSYFTPKGSVYERSEDGDGVAVLVPVKSSLLEKMGEHSDDADFADFLRALLTVDPKLRPSAEEALRHPWLRKEMVLEPYVMPVAST
jgi:serine/threonine protein kinase